MLADALSRCPTHAFQEVLLVQGTGVTHETIDVLVDECYEALLSGCPVAD